MGANTTERLSGVIYQKESITHAHTTIQERKTYQIDRLLLNNPRQMPDQKLEYILVAFGQITNRSLEREPTFLGILQTSRLQDAVIDVKRDERVRQLAEILLQTTGHGVDIEILIGNVVAAVALEAGLDLLHLPTAAGFAIYTFDVHAAELDFFDTARHKGGKDTLFVVAARSEF